MSRPGRQRLEMDDRYIEKKMQCPRCSKKFRHIFDLDRHLVTDHNLSNEIREVIYMNMNVRWYQNYAPPGRWKGLWAE